MRAEPVMDIKIYAVNDDFIIIVQAVTIIQAKNLSVRVNI